MCGICGIVNWNGSGVDETPVRTMMRTMKHRGPDDEGICVEKNIGLGFVRLSIIDVSSAGHQPMHDDHHDYTIIFNGEIYNYIELRTQLIQEGQYFTTQTDTEVLLKAYLCWGEAFLHKLNGMFAFVILDRKRRILFGARDRYGVKPFYYRHDHGSFTFASEIPALLAISDQKASANEQSIFDYLVFNRTNATADTFFKGIQKLQHGHKITISTDKNEVKIEPWYRLDSMLTNPYHSSDEFMDDFRSSCALRMRSDVPVGVCLSGGIDSSSVVSVLLRDFNLQDLNTFSAVYNKGDIGDESSFINLYRDQLANMHFVTPNAEALLADLDDFIFTQSEPVPTTSIYAQYKVCQLAQKHVTVALDGQGADEYLAGYLYFLGFYYKGLIKEGRFGRLLSENYHFLKNNASLFGLKSLLFFFLPETLRTQIMSTKVGYLEKEFYKKYSNTNAISGNLYGSDDLRSSMLNHFEYKMEHNLLWKDKNSMRFSIELREPFLDYRLVERTLASNMDMLINKGYTKAILRDAMKGYLPEEIRLRKDKMGFTTPEDRWFRTPEVSTMVHGILNDRRMKDRNIINQEKAKSIYQKHLSGKANLSRDIWKMIHLELWYRKFID